MVPNHMAGTPHPDPEHQLEFLLHAVSRSLLRAYNEEFRALGLSQSQAGVLLQVDWADARTQTAIARRLGIQKAATGALIMDLEERGLLKRRRSETDARMMEVSLTAKGRRKLQQINDFAARLGPLVTNGIAADEMAVAMDVLRRVRANAEAMETGED